MEESKRSPVVIPFALVHIGVLGCLSLFLIVLHGSRPIQLVGLFGGFCSVLLIVAGLFAIMLLRTKREYHSDAMNALNALRIFILPFIAYVGLPFMVASIFPLGLLLILLTPLLLQLMMPYISRHSAPYYCQLLKWDRPKTIRCILFLFFLFVNTGAFLFYHEIFKHSWPD